MVGVRFRVLTSPLPSKSFEHAKRGTRCSMNVHPITTPSRMGSRRGYSVRTYSQIPMAHKPLYVCAEGIDSSGKSTALLKLADYLEANGKEVLMVEEPTLEARADLETNPPATVFDACVRFGDDRRTLLRDVVWPALQEGIWVLSSRSGWSSFAYQVSLGLDVNICDEIVFKSVFPVGLPGQCLLFRYNDRLGQRQNKDLLAGLEGRQSHSEDMMRKIDAMYGKLAKADSPTYKTRWWQIPALPSQQQLTEVFGLILGYGSEWELLREQEWQKSIEEWR